MLMKVFAALALFSVLAVGLPRKRGYNNGPSPLTRQEFKNFIENFVDDFEAGSNSVANVEVMAYQALATQGGLQEWTNVAQSFAASMSPVVDSLGPHLDGVGELLKRLFNDTDDFAEPTVCDSLRSYVDDGYTNGPLGFAIAVIEDIGCFKQGLAKVRHIDLDDMDDEEYSEREAVRLILDIFEESQQLVKSYIGFWESMAKLAGGGSKKSLDLDSDKVDSLVRLLKELDIDLDDLK